MSQFLLAHDVDSSLLPQSIEVVPAVNEQSLEEAGVRIFGADAIEKVTTVIIDGEDFDTVFLQAQRDLIDGMDYESTRLSEVLKILSKAAKRFALWYGNGYDDLEVVHDTQGLAGVVREGLSAPSVEAYVIFSMYRVR